MQSYVMQVNSIISSLPSGYNRDFQLTKEPLMNGFELAKKCISVMALVIGNIEVNKEKCEAACTDDIFATQKALELVKKGINFRDAYKQVSKNQKI